MSLSTNLEIRKATARDSLCLGVLATQVFLDTYATEGVNEDLADEVTQIYSPVAYEKRLTQRDTEITLALVSGNLVGFLELQTTSECKALSFAAPEVVRLYIQRPFQRLGLGKRFLGMAETRAKELNARSVWLTAWVGNSGALAFYPKVGYRDVGSTQYAINGVNYENRIFEKAVSSAA